MPMRYRKRRLGFPSKKTKTRIKGGLGFAETIAKRNPIVHTIVAAKETFDNSYRLYHGKEPEYRRKIKRLTA